MRFEFNRLIKFSGSYIYLDDPASTAINRICSKCIDRAIKSYITIITIEMLSFVCAIIGPLYEFIFYDSRVTAFNIRIPFMEDDPETEFDINCIWGMWSGYVGVCAFMLMEVIFALINNMLNVTTEQLELELEAFSLQLESSEISQVEIRRKLSNIFRKNVLISKSYFTVV